MAEKDVKLLGGGTNPVGTILTFFGDTAPDGYLTCDGTEYNKSDYPELSEHLLSLTSASQYEVTGDETKFKVPDLRGEFLRGTGTNSHENSGSGDNVGVHQTPSFITTIYVQSARIYARKLASSNFGPMYTDSTLKGSMRQQQANCADQNPTTAEYAHSIRPTNTSVLYCIKF